MSIKLKKTIADKERYLKIFLCFFEEIGFNKREEAIKLLNKLNHKYVAKLLYALIFYQYCEQVIDKKDDILRPVLLICLIDATEVEGSLINKIKIFLRRLDDEDKLYLLNNLLVLKGKRKNKSFRRIYHDLCKRHKNWKHFEGREYSRNMSYQYIDPSLKKIDKYLDEIAKHFYCIRNQALHESKQILYASMSDEEYNITPSSLFLCEAKPRGKKKVVNHILSSISFLELQKIIKRGILRKIKDKN